MLDLGPAGSLGPGDRHDVEAAGAFDQLMSLEKAERQIGQLALLSGVDVDAYPSAVPDLYSDEPVLVKARLAGPLPDDAAVAVSGNVPGGAWTERVPLAAGHDSPGVGALWARARIRELMDAVRRSRTPGIARDALVETALRYRIVTRYTSLVAVDRTPGRAAYSAHVASRNVMGSASLTAGSLGSV